MFQAIQLSYKVNDLNVEAEESGDDEDDVDWEEGWIKGSASCDVYGIDKGEWAVYMSHSLSCNHVLFQR